MATASKVANQISIMGFIPTPIRIIMLYLMKNNILKLIVVNLLTSIKNVLLANKNLKVAKRRVNHMAYRLNQMERLIEYNNYDNFIKGRNLNQLR